MEITRIIKVVDTREYEEVDDRWRPIPGSGTENQCSRCGRLHEVHATVELKNGSTTIVGTGCMKSDSVEIQSGIKRLTSASKRIAKLEAERKKYISLIAEKESIEARVRELPLPSTSQHVVDKKDESGYEYKRYEIHFGDGSRPYVSLREIAREDCIGAKTHWRRNKERELGLTYTHDSAERKLNDVERSIEKIEDKYSELREEPR